MRFGRPELRDGVSNVTTLFAHVLVTLMRCQWVYFGTKWWGLDHAACIPLGLLWTGLCDVTDSLALVVGARLWSTRWQL